MNDSVWMQRAMNQARLAYQNQEVPVGAVLVSEQGIFLAEASNQMINLSDPTAHAEMLVLRSAGQLLKNYRLNGCTLYVTLEPCPMCAAAMVHARIKRLVFATRDFKTGAAGSVINLLKGAPWNAAISLDEGLMQRESAQLLETFFSERRVYPQSTSKCNTHHHSNS